MLRRFSPLRRVRKHPRRITHRQESPRPLQSRATYPATRSRSPAPSCTQAEFCRILPHAHVRFFPSPQYSQRTIASAPRVRASLRPSSAPTRYFSALAPPARKRRPSPKFLHSHSSPLSPPHKHALQRAPPANTQPPAPTASRSKYSASPLFSPSSNAGLSLQRRYQALTIPWTGTNEVKFAEGRNSSSPRFKRRRRRRVLLQPPGIPARIRPSRSRCAARSLLHGSLA